MKKILYFLMVGFAFTALQVGTAEAVKDCAGFTPGTPPFQSCVDANAKAALNNNEGNQSGGDAGAGAMQNNSGAATPTGAPGAAAMGDHSGTAPMGAPGTAPTGTPGTDHMGAPSEAPMGDPSAKPSLVDRFKGMLGLGTEVPPTGAAGGNLEDPCALVEGPERDACYAAAPGNDGPPIDPRSGQAFTEADEAKFQKYADECEATKGLLSEGSTQELVKEGFTQIQVEDLCKNGPQTAPPAQ